VVRDDGDGMDAWNQADAYEPYVGRWSRLLAPRFLAWTGWRGGEVVDVGCGTGALSQALLAGGATRLAGFDLSASYVRQSRAAMGSLRARFEVGDAQRLPLPDASFDAAMSGLVLNFVPEPARMLREMRRVVRPGGLVALYVWDYGGKMEMIRAFWDAAVALDPQARALDEGRRFPVCRPEALEALAREAGLREVTSAAIDQPTLFGDFDDYWTPFLGGQGPAPGYCASLAPAARDALRERLRASLPTMVDGRIPLVARAWAVRGRV